LDDIKIGPASIEHFDEIDVRFHVCFILVEIGNGHILSGAGDEAEMDAFPFHDHLIVRAKGRRTTRLARVDGVSRRYVYPRRLVCRIFARRNNSRTCDPSDQNTIFFISYSLRVRRGEHQEEILPRRRIGETEFQVISDADIDHLRQVKGIVGISPIRIRQGIVLHGPEFSACCCFLQIYCDYDGAIGIGFILICCTRYQFSLAAQDDVVILCVCIEKDGDFTDSRDRSIRN